MGQEFLEDKRWSDTPNPATEIWWQGLESGDKAMSDFFRFTRELIGLRKNQPALRGEGCAIVQVHNQNRVLAFQRWVQGVGNDVMVVASINDNVLYSYPIGFSGYGRWAEVSSHTGQSPEGRTFGYRFLRAPLRSDSKLG